MANTYGLLIMNFTLCIVYPSLPYLSFSHFSFILCLIAVFSIQWSRKFMVVSFLAVCRAVRFRIYMFVYLSLVTDDDALLCFLFTVV